MRWTADVDKCQVTVAQHLEESKLDPLVLLRCALKGLALTSADCFKNAGRGALWKFKPFLHYQHTWFLSDEVRRDFPDECSVIEEAFKSEICRSKISSSKERVQTSKRSRSFIVICSRAERGEFGKQSRVWPMKKLIVKTKQFDLAKSLIGIGNR